MSRTTYILKAYGENKSVILAESQKELGKKTCSAIAIEEQADEKTTTVQFPEYMGDWGEDTSIVAQFVNEGSLITNTEYSLQKVVHI